MASLRTNESADSVLETLETTGIRLATHADLARFAEANEAHITDIEAKRTAHRKAAAARMAGTLIIRRRDREVNKAYMLLARAVGAATNGDRDAPVYRALFHKTPSLIIRPIGGDEQARDIELTIQALEREPSAEPFRHHAAPLRAALAALTEAENARKALYLAEASAQLALRAAVDQAVGFYNSLHTQLMVIFNDDEDEVRSYLG